MNDERVAAMQNALRLERRAAKEAANLGISACVMNDVDMLLDGLDAISETIDGWARFFRKAAIIAPPSDEVRAEFTLQWVLRKSRRAGTRHDLTVLAALRRLLLPYEGSEIRLFRGASARERKRRAYGISWTDDPDIAASFASNSPWRSRPGGTVVLECLAKPAAILGTTLSIGDPFGEREYFVDRRQLVHVTVKARFAQTSG
jgi:hypothetical protein